MAIELCERHREGEKVPTRARSKVQETHVAKVTGGTRNPNSGATDFSGKADVNLDNLFSIECKTKMESSKSMTIKKEWVEKLKQETVFDGNKEWAIAFNFGPNEPCYYVIDENLFIMLCEVLKNEQGK